MTTAILISVCILAVILLALCIDWRLKVDGKRDADVPHGLRSARRRLTVRHAKAEIHATALRLRRELDGELNAPNSPKGGFDVEG